MEDLIEKNMGLILTVVDRFQPQTQLDKEAYIQAGRIGLWKALKKFSTTGGSKFSPYAWNPIRWEIIKEIRAMAGKEKCRDIHEYDLAIEEPYTKNASISTNFEDLLPDNLTKVEFDVIKFKREGYNFKEISTKLDCHRSHIKKIFDSAINKIRETNQ